MKYLTYFSIAMLMTISACGKTNQGTASAPPQEQAAPGATTQTAPAAMTEADKDKKPADPAAPAK